MTEVLTRPADHEPIEPDMLGFEQSIDNTRGQVDERPEIRSNAADRVRGAAERIAGLFDRRAQRKAVNAAHKEALAQYRDTDRDSYREHINKLAVDSDTTTRAHIDAYATATYENARHSGIVAKEASVEFGESVVDATERAGKAVRNVGVAAIEITVGTGVMVAGGALAGIEKGKQAAGDAKESIKGRFSAYRERAQLRKQARRDRWSRRGEKATEFARDTMERGRLGVETRRAAGRAALDAYHQSLTTHQEQNNLDKS